MSRDYLASISSLRPRPVLRPALLLLRFFDRGAAVVPVSDYLEGIRLELGRIAAANKTASIGLWSLETLYLGGGTPSRLGADGVKSLMHLIGEYASLSAEAEVTLEANPDDVTAEAIESWVDSGINRISSRAARASTMECLSWMHRTHNAKQIYDAVSLIRSGGIHNLSLDLIFALPDELNRTWTDDLEKRSPSSPSTFRSTV